MKGFKIIHPGLQATFQDEGRIGYQNQGVPISGAMDQEAMTIANLLVGKSKGAVLEMTYLGVTIEFMKSMAIAITGADMEPEINNQPVEMYVTQFVKQGDRLAFKGLKKGFRAYVSFSDKLLLDEVFGSKSTYIKGQIGGYKGRQLQKDDVIDVESLICENKYRYFHQRDEEEIRVIIGYEHEAFFNVQDIFKKPYTVRQEVDRMGMRLDGLSIEHKESADIISSPIVPGAIQVPKNGQPMIMLRDAQTIGGYTRIGCVLSCDLDKLAQKKPGDQIKFVPIDYAEGVKVKKAYLQKDKTLIEDDQVKKYEIRVNGKAFKVLVEEI